MKDIETVYCDGHNITMYDPNGNISISAPLNLDSFIMDVKYDGGSLVITHSDGREERICTDALVDDSLGRITGNWGFSRGDGYSYGYHDGNSTNAILARITAKVLGEFLQTPDGVRAIEKELNNYFNGTS
jgi:hypothetical protein